MPTNIEALKNEWEEHIVDDIDLNKFNQFHNLFPIEELKNLELDRYTNLTSNGDNYFAHWVEQGTQDYGSGSGNSFKLGVYKPNYKNVDKKKLGNDEQRIKTWISNAKEKYKTLEQKHKYEEFVDREVAIEYYEDNVKPRLITLSNFQQLESVRPLDINWSRKIAYLYNPGKMLSLYNNQIIRKLANFLEMETDTTNYKVTEPLLNKLVEYNFIETVPDDRDDALRLTLKLSNFLYEKFKNQEVVDETESGESEADNESTEGNDMDEPRNTIFYGPPGTGKTRESIKQAAKIINNFKTFNNYEEAKDLFNKHLHNRIEFITFHQNYSYEDFVQGIRPDTENNRDLIFELRDGIFKKLADEALRNYKNSTEGNGNNNLIAFDEVFNQFFEQLITEGGEIEIKMKTDISFSIYDINEKSIFFEKQQGTRNHTLSIGTLKALYESTRMDVPLGLSSYYLPLIEKLKEIGGQNSNNNETEEELKNFVLVIDEINRANISRVFGELITLIEEDKRYGKDMQLSVKLPSGENFIVPPNLYIIGTMNTADKSIALLDIALRRRFKFIPLYPEYAIHGHEIYNVEILRNINNTIIETKGHDFQIGHSYFMEDENLEHLMNTKIIPLLLEYYMNDAEKVKEILGAANLRTVQNKFPLEI